MKKLILTIALLGFVGYSGFAQSDDDLYSTGSDDSYEYGDDYDYDEVGGGSVDDSTAPAEDPYADGGYEGFDAGGYTPGSDYVRSSRPKFEHKTYERFTGMPYDSATELITYVEIIDVVVPGDYLGEPYDYADSLHARAMKWMGIQFGEKQVKKMLEEAGPDTKNREGLTIKAIAKLPLLVELNKFAKEKAGLIQFDMELRFKDGRYRYKFNNFVHVEEDQTEGKEPITTYLEYYLDAKANVESNDRILIATNNQMNTLIDDLKRTCAAKPFIDDDDW